jgi:hypothetical protein
MTQLADQEQEATITQLNANQDSTHARISELDAQRVPFQQEFEEAAAKRSRLDLELTEKNASCGLDVSVLTLSLIIILFSHWLPNFLFSELNIKML